MEITIDMSEVLLPYQELANQLAILDKRILNEVTNRIYMEWITLAKSELRTSRQEYINSLYIKEGDESNEIILDGTLPNSIEEGMSAYDMKEGFANSPKAKHKKDGGWYLTIPFKFKAPGGGNRVGNILPSQIYKLAKMAKLAAGSVKINVPIAIGDKKGSTTPRGEFSSIMGRKSFPGFTPKASNIYSGLTKTINPATGKGSYSTFRRVSDKSAPGAFIHPGIVAHNLGQKAQQRVNIDLVAQSIIDEELNRLFNS